MSIRCYKPHRRPLAIGFDLDDTLYDNLPVLRQAEQKLQQYLNQHYPKTKQYSLNDWLKIRNDVVAAQPSLSHDVTLSRLAALEQGLLQLGYCAIDAKQGSKAALTEFLHWRNQVIISNETAEVLRQLAQKCRLFIITNGNADVTQLGINELIEFSLSASTQLAMKPASDLFQLAERKLQLTGTDILYVGDHPVSDVVGASNAGWQSCWFNPNQKTLQHIKKPLQLPTFEIDQLKELLVLFD
ncbi:MAG: HAD-IA family hydrolase [Psychrobium sp.]|nr:HAD-IA family hydrolase [Psychrobium sp.]